MTIIFNLLRIGKIISKYQILTHFYPLKLPLKTQIFGYFLTLFLSPLSLFKNPSKEFGSRLTTCLTKLGPIYIKFGQTLSTRPDLVGEQIANYLQTLQDKLPPFDGITVKKLIENSFGKNIDKLFLEFNGEPIAAASISQVHKAQLNSGEFVAIKILRPNIHHNYNQDIKLLYFFAKIVSKFKKARRLKPLLIVEKFRETMKHELDLRLEAAAASELSDNFSKDLDVYIPKIFWQFTSENILTTEWIDGISIYDKKQILAYGLKPSSIAQKFAVMFFNQAYRDGFFHADLHPGNILVKPDGTIILLDFGIMGRLGEADRLAIAESLFGFLSRDYKLVAEVHKKAGYVPKDTNLDFFAQSCRAVTEPIVGLPAKDISIGKLLSHLFKITEDFGMEVQPNLLLLQKTIVMVEGIGQQLDSEINMWQLAEPWIKKWAAKNLSPEAKLLRFIKRLSINLF